MSCKPLGHLPAQSLKTKTQTKKRIISTVTLKVALSEIAAVLLGKVVAFEGTEGPISAIPGLCCREGLEWKKPEEQDEG